MQEMYVFLFITLCAFILYSLTNFKNLLESIEKRLSPEEQRNILNERDVLKDKAAQLTKKLSQSHAENKESLVKITAINDNLESVQQDNNTLSKQVLQLKSQNDGYRREVESAKKILEDQDKTISRLKKELSQRNEAVKSALENLTKIDENEKKNKNTEALISNKSCVKKQEKPKDWNTCNACGAMISFCRCAN